MFAEVSAPITKQLELQAALRYERYQVSGGATSPKLGLRYVPTRELLLRASVGAGFRAPSLSDLYRPVTQGTSATLVDPVCLASDPNNTVTDCSDIWTTLNYSNAKLKPEKSRQFSLGVVFEPVRDLSVSVDYWNIQKSDLISTLGVDVILGNLDKYGNLVNRDSDDVIDSIDLVKQNRGKQKISGLDINLALNRIASPVGTLGLRLNGTLTLQSKQQTGDGDPYVSNLGRFINDGVVQRWRHSLAVDWEQGPFGATLSNSHLSGYKDQFIIGKADTQRARLFAVEPERPLGGDARAEAARQRQQPVRQGAAVLAAGLVLPVGLRPELHRPARPQRAVQPELHLPVNPRA